MKKRIVSILLALMTVLFCSLTGCKNDVETQQGGVYIIQYTDDQGTHQLEVTQGAPYTISTVPQKTGYDFMGFFDAENGGTQYVLPSGASVGNFNVGQNLTLYPQFKPKNYKFILDYQGGSVTGARELTVAYDSQLPELPKNLVLEHKNFVGWFTEKNCEGTKVADQYGLIPVVSILNEKNFDIESDDGYIYLYAGFEIETFAVTFHFGNEIPIETMKIAYDTPISKIVANTRNNNGYAVLSWSKTEGGPSAGTERIEGPIDLYAIEWAPCINFDTDGGDKVTALVARAGDTVALPTATKELAKFMYWIDEIGDQANITSMPSNSITLKAVWQGKLVFDENGGSEVQDISVSANQDVTLPTPEKEGYIFAGWYTESKELYSSTKMPVAGIKLKAGWYKAKTEKVIILKKDYDSLGDCANSGKIYKETLGPKASWRQTIDLSKYIAKEGATIFIDLYYDIRNQDAMSTSAGFYFYSSEVVSDAYFLGKTIKANEYLSGWVSANAQFEFKLTSNVLYMCYYAKHYDGYGGKVYFNNAWMNLTYPDTSYLYL